MPQLNAVLPHDVHTYRGHAWARWFAVGLTVVITIRSLIHIFRDDGGASSIAGIDITVEGGGNLVALFAQWGVVQLLLAAVAWIAVLRYRGLIPLILFLNLLENIGRIAVGRRKPIRSTHTPPGARGSLILVPALTAALWCSLSEDERSSK